MKRSEMMSLVRQWREDPCWDLEDAGDDMDTGALRELLSELESASNECSSLEEHIKRAQESVAAAEEALREAQSLLMCLSVARSPMRQAMFDAEEAVYQLCEDDTVYDDPPEGW